MTQLRALQVRQLKTDKTKLAANPGRKATSPCVFLEAINDKRHALVHRRYIMKSILVALTEFLFLGALLFGISLMVTIDRETFLAGGSENTVIQYTQESLILLSAILFSLSAWRRPESRGVLVLVAGLFGCMFIRELNNLLDNIASGFWVYPAVLLAATCIVYARYCGSAVLVPMAKYTQTRSYIYLSIGLLIVLLFSRVFGSGSLWRELMMSDYQVGYKKIIQEVLELQGYVLIAYGSWLAYRNK